MSKMYVRSLPSGTNLINDNVRSHLDLRQFTSPDRESLFAAIAITRLNFRDETSAHFS